jgi:hypothetical protein
VWMNKGGGSLAGAGGLGLRFSLGLGHRAALTRTHQSEAYAQNPKGGQNAKRHGPDGRTNQQN